MDNLSSHKGPKVRALIAVAGAKLIYLPRYSPDFNTIENAFAKLKALLRRPLSGPSTVSGPPSGSFSIFTPRECANYFAAAAYDAT